MLCPPGRGWLDAAPAGGGALSGGDAVETGDRLVGHQADPGVEEVESSADSGLGALGCEPVDGGDAQLGHPARVLLGGGPDDSLLDVADTGAAAVDRDDEDAVGMAGSL